MRAEGLRAHVRQRSFLHRDVARGASIHHAQFGQPGLLQPRLKASLQSRCIPAKPDQAQILLLILGPFAKVIFGRDYRKTQHQHYAQRAKCMRTVAEQERPRLCDLSLEIHQALHGQTHAQPAPRKKVPMIVSTEAWIRNQVMIQNESGFDTSHRRNLCGESGWLAAARNMKPATISVGIRIAQTCKTRNSSPSTPTTIPTMRNRRSLSFSHTPCASILMLK